MSYDPSRKLKRKTVRALTIFLEQFWLFLASGITSMSMTIILDYVVYNTTYIQGVNAYEIYPKSTRSIDFTEVVWYNSYHSRLTNQ